MFVVQLVYYVHVFLTFIFQTIFEKKPRDADKSPAEFGFIFLSKTACAYVEKDFVLFFYSQFIHPSISEYILFFF